MANSTKNLHHDGAPIISILMKPSKIKWITGVGVFVGLWTGSALIASDNPPSGAPTAGQIFETMRENYATLKSYSDSGQICTALDGGTNVTDFTTRLARPGFYRIQWNQPDSSDPGTHAAWSLGVSSYIQMGTGIQRQPDRDVSLANLTTSSGGEVATVPTLFFNPQTTDWADKVIGLERLADDKIGKIDCYQITGQLETGETKTFWIGKDDFFIYQIRTEADPGVLRAAWTSTTGHPVPGPDVHSFSSIETFTNIAVNVKLYRPDFVPSCPMFDEQINR